MAKSRKSLKKPRSTAYNRQAGHCYYCGHPMWLENPPEFASEHNMTLGEAKRFQCTGEHLIAHQEGGPATQKNIVAACLYCNQKRHQRKRPPQPNQYKEFVVKRLIRGGWHGRHWGAMGLLRLSMDVCDPQIAYRQNNRSALVNCWRRAIRCAEHSERVFRDLNVHVA